MRGDTSSSGDSGSSLYTCLGWDLKATVPISLVNAIVLHFQGASWQRCQTHFIRNVLEVRPKSLQRKSHARLQHTFDALD